MARLAHTALLAGAALALASGCSMRSVGLEDFDTQTLSLEADPGVSDRFYVRLVREHEEACGYLNENVEATVNGHPLELVGRGIPSYTRDFGPQCPAAVFEGAVEDLAPAEGEVTRIVVSDGQSELVFAVRNAHVERRLELVGADMGRGQTVVARWFPESDVLASSVSAADLMTETASFVSLNAELTGHELRMQLPVDLPAGRYGLLLSQQGEAEVVECTAPACRQGVMAESETLVQID
jgi:hypothetical protein